MKKKEQHSTLAKAIPFYIQVYRKLQDDILSGYLKKGDRLPSIRKAVGLFHVSKTSIERAYVQLMLDGWIIPIAKKGYYVDVDKSHIAIRKEVMNEPVSLKEETIRYDFNSQSMDIDAFDSKVWKKYIKDVLDHHHEIVTYGDGQGERILRNALRAYAYSMRGVLCREEQILIGASFQSLLYILCGLCTRPIIFGMEENSFPPFQRVVEDYGIPLRILPMDEQGVQMDALYQSDCNLLYMNSVSCGNNHQPITSKRRNELLLWAKAKKAMIIEDDHNGELRYQSRMTPAMQGFDDGEHLIYIGSFSKLLLPSLRISYMVLPDCLLQRFLARKQSYSPTSSKIEQLALAHYISDGHLERHLKRIKKRYARKSQRMEALLHTYFKEATIYLEESALQFLMRMQQPYDSVALLRETKTKGIRITLSTKHELILSFAAIPIEDMEQAIKELHTIWEQVLK